MDIMNRMRILRYQLQRLQASIVLFRVLSMMHLALVTDAGLFILMVFVPSLLDAQLAPKPVSLAFFLGYVVCDLVRLAFLRGATISLGFPLISLALLADSPSAALLVATLGSLVSEALWCRLSSKQHLSWLAASRRIFFYAGHHAVASLGALIAYQLIRSRFDALFQLETIHIQAILAYVVLYSLVSMLLVWPHDIRTRLFLAPGEEPFVRVDLFSTLLLLPIPTAIYFLFSSGLGQTEGFLILIGALPLLGVALFYLARRFTKVEEERAQLELRLKISQLLGSPANIAEMVERMLIIMQQLLDYRWGAVYSLIDGQLHLYGVKPHDASVIILDTREVKGKVRSKEDIEPGNDVTWPLQIGPDGGVIEKLTRESLWPQFFEDGLVPATASDPYLPPKTALITFPITAQSQWGEAKEEDTPKMIGLIALARPKRRFTIGDWDKGQALSGSVGNLLLSVQRLERVMREVYQKVQDYAEDPEKVRQAMRELALRQVDVAKILAVLSARSFRGNLRAVLTNVVEGRKGYEVALAPDTLIEIYDQVHDETPGMPPINSDIVELLQTITSSLSLAFSFRYQFPDVDRGPAFKEFYEFLLDALDANTASRIAALDSRIVSTVDAVRKRDGTATGSSALPHEAIEEVERLRDIAWLLKKYGRTDDFTDQRVSLGQALDSLVEREHAVRDRLRDPERFVFLQILAGWRTAITNALEDVGRGPARLSVSLRSLRALLLDEITVGLVLRNEGPGVASRVLVRLEPSSSYEILKGEVDAGTLTAGKTVKPEFTLQSEGEGPLRLQFHITYNDPERKSKVEEFADLLYLLDPPCFAGIPNPYTPGLPLKPGNPTFVGREDIFNFIVQNTPALVQKMILVLIGERRTGLTSILQQLPTRLNDSRYIPIFIDGQALGIDPGIESFFLSLAVAINDGLKNAGIPITPLSLAELREGPQLAFERRFLPKVRERIGERTLLLTVDSFEELGDRVIRGRLPVEVFPYLRHLIQHSEQLAFIFAGTHQIEELIGDYWSVLFNIAKYKKVGFLKHEDAIRLITDPVQPYGMVYDDLAIDEILRLTDGHPYFTQLLCHILVNRSNQASCSYVTVQDVRGAVEELLETGRAHLTFIWNTSDRVARLSLAALAELRDQLDQVTADAISDRLEDYAIHLDPAPIMKTMEQLTRRDITREILSEVAGISISYDFAAQLYARWIRRYEPLSKVVGEEAVEPATAVDEGQDEETWQQIKQSMENHLFANGSITLERLASIAGQGRRFGWSRYLDEYRAEFDFVEAAPIRFRNEQGLNSLNEAWQRMLSVVTPQGAIEDVFDQCATDIVEQLESVGFRQLTLDPLLRHLRPLVFLLDTRLAFGDVKLPSAVPLVFIRRLGVEEGDIREIRHLLHAYMIPSCNLVFVVVPIKATPRQRIENLLRDKFAPYACDVVLIGLEELQRIIVALEPQAVLRRLVLSKINLISVCPFIITGATSDRLFFGREQELREIRQHIATISYAVIGGRRIGKSSLLGRLHRVRLSTAGFRTVYQDCSPTPTHDAFLNAPIEDWQPEPPSDAPVAFGDLLRSPAGDKPLVLLLDEADKLVSAERANRWQLFSMLRALANSNRAQVVLSGERGLRAALRDPKSPLFNFANEILLGPLDYRAVEELVTRPMTQLGIELVDQKAIVGRIWAFTAGHPNIVQRLCRRLVERLSELNSRRITLDDVNAVIEDPGFQRDDFLSTYWEAATPLEKILSLLMADSDHIRTLHAVQQALAQRCNLSPKIREVDDALQRLVDLRSILRRTPDGYEFATEAFPSVVGRTMTLRDMLEIITEEYQEQGE